MKKFIQWLAKVFNANITTEKVVTKEVVKEVTTTKEVIKYLTNGTIKGDVNVDGTLVVKYLVLLILNLYLTQIDIALILYLIVDYHAIRTKIL